MRVGAAVCGLSSEALGRRTETLAATLLLPLALLYGATLRTGVRPSASTGDWTVWSVLALDAPERQRARLGRSVRALLHKARDMA